MNITLTYAYRIYLSEKQKTKFETIVKQSDLLYNMMLEKAKCYYGDLNEVMDIRKMLHIYYRERRKGNALLEPFDVMCSVGKLTVNKLNKDIRTSMYTSMSFPRNKIDRHEKSFRFDPKKENMTMKRNMHGSIYIVLPILGTFRIVYHRRLPEKFICNYAVIKKESDGTFKIYFVITFDKDTEQIYPQPDCRKVLGLDFSMKNFFVASDSNIMPDINQIAFSNKEMKSLQTRNKAIKRKEKGSAGYEKARLAYTKTYKRLVRRRKNHFHNLAHEIVKKYDVIGIENLDLKSMKENKHYGKCIEKLAYNDFITILKSKAKMENKKVIEMPCNFPSSKICNNCHNINKNLKVYEKTWNCPSCKKQINRDLNAAYNIRDKAIELISIR